MSRWAIPVGCVGWALVGLLLAVSGLDNVNADARVLVLSATALGVGAALLAAWLWSRDRPRWAGLCLVVSVITPTWFAAALNLVPFAMGLALVTGRYQPRHRTTVRSGRARVRGLREVGVDGAVGHREA